MHELFLTRQIVELVTAAAEREHSARVERVRLLVGALSCIEPEALRFCFDVVARGTSAAGARLEIERDPAEGSCPRCLVRTAVCQLPASCLACDESLLIEGGTGVKIDEIEVM